MLRVPRYPACSLPENNKEPKNGAPWPPRCRRRHRHHPASRWHGNPARGCVSSSFVHNYRVVPSRCVGVVRNGGYLALPATVKMPSPNPFAVSLHTSALPRGRHVEPPRGVGRRTTLASSLERCLFLWAPVWGRARVHAGWRVWGVGEGGPAGPTSKPPPPTHMLMLQPSPARLLLPP